MSETYQFNLPLLAASQAQKHITVNAALTRLDAVVQLRFKSKSQTSPPVNPTDGEAFFIPTGSSGN